MAYGIKYRHIYCDEFGNNSSVSILKKDYTGSVSEVDAQVDPIVVSKENSEFNKFNTINPTAASVGLIGSDTFSLEELFTTDERGYMIEKHISGALNWRGFVIPNGFSHPRKSGIYPMEIIASDNLNTLHKLKFLNDDGTVIKGRFNHIDILLKCLSKLGIDLDLLTITGIVRQGGIAGEDPLFINTVDAYTFLDTKVKQEGIDFYYDDPDNAFTCEDVVNSICSIYGATLYQDNGFWVFKRVNIDYGSNISGLVYNRYNQSGIKVGTIPYPDPIIIPCVDLSGDIEESERSNISMSEVYKSSQSRYGYRYRVAGDILPEIIKNQILDYPFPRPDPIDFIPVDWTVKLYQLIPPLRDRSMNIAPELNPGGDFPPDSTGGAIRIYGGNRSAFDSLRSSPIGAGSNINKGDRLSFKFWHKTPSFIAVGISRLSYLCLVRVSLVSENGRSSWYLKNSDVTLPLSGSLGSKIVHNPSWVQAPREGMPILPSLSFFNPKPVTDPMIWIQEYLISQPAPSNGKVTIEFSGIGFPEDAGIQPPVADRTGSKIPAFAPSGVVFNEDTYTTSFEEKKTYIYNNEFKLGELEVGALVGGLIPSGKIYTSEQDANFTQSGERIGLLTADVANKNAIGTMLTNGVVVDKWDDDRNSYGSFRPLGLMLTRDVMRQYKNIWRIIEEDIKVQGLSFSSTFEFEERPGERYKIQRGSISSKFNRLIAATLVQVSAIPDSPFIGTETTVDDFRTDSGSSNGGGSSGGGGGGGSAPQNLQQTTDIGAITDSIITIGGSINERLLTIPLAPPLPEEIVAGKPHIWFNSLGNGAPTPPAAQYFRDNLDVLKPLLTGTLKYDDITKMVYSDPNGGGDVTKAWVEANFATLTDPRFHTHTNKSVLDGITATRVMDWDIAYSWVGHYVKKDGDEMTGDLAIGGTRYQLGGYRTLSVGSPSQVGLIKFRSPYNSGDGAEMYQDSLGSTYFNVNGSTYGFIISPQGYLRSSGLLGNFSHLNNFIDLSTPFSGGLSVVNAGMNYGLHVMTNHTTGNTIFQSKRSDAIKEAYNLLFQNRGGGVGIGVDEITGDFKFQVGRSSGSKLSGTLLMSNGSPRVNGSYTKFLTDFKRGQEIWIKGNRYYVYYVYTDIAMDICLTPDGAPYPWPSATEANITYTAGEISAFSVAGNGNSVAKDLNVTENFSLPIQEEPINPEVGRVYLYIKPSNLI